MGESEKLLTLEDGLRLQDDLIKGYMSEEFQQAMWTAFKRAGDDPAKQLLAKAETCQTVQFPLMEKYGFTPDRKGVQASLKAFTPEMNAHPLVMEKNILMQYLIDPKQQQEIAEKDLPAPAGVCPSRRRTPHPSEWPEESGKVYRVVGGGEKGGILVRKGEDTKSQELKDRLATHALVELVEKVGDRLHYQKMTGNGPELGWVSLSFKGKPLLEPLWHDPEPSAGEKATFKVVHDRVAKRASPSKDGKMVGGAKKGETIKGEVIKVEGVDWVKFRETVVGSTEPSDVYMMVEGSSVGLGQLLEKV